MEEIWKEINNSECHYVSNFGRIKNSKGKVLKTWNCNGYRQTQFSKSGKKYLVHRLVAEYFLDNPNEYPFINHIDNNRSNNNLSNIEWCTQKQNVQHYMALGLRKTPSGEKHFNAILNTSTVLIVREAFNVGYKINQIARYFKVSRATIQDVIYKRTWSHI